MDLMELWVQHYMPRNPEKPCPPVPVVTGRQASVQVGPARAGKPSPTPPRQSSETWEWWIRQTWIRDTLQKASLVEGESQHTTRQKNMDLDTLEWVKGLPALPLWKWHTAGTNQPEGTSPAGEKESGERVPNSPSYAGHCWRNPLPSNSTQSTEVGPP